MNVDFDEATHTYRIDGAIVPSVTQCLQLLDPFQSVDRAVLAAARAFGQAGHRAMALLVRDRLNWRTLDPGLLPFIEAGAEFLRKTDLLILASEKVVASKVLGCAGTLDLEAEDEKYGYVIEFKFTSDQPWTAGPQTVAYERLLHLSTPHDRRLKRRRMCVVLKEGKFDVEMLNDTSDWNTFLSCLNVTKARLKHGIR